MWQTFKAFALVQLLTVPLGVLDTLALATIRKTAGVDQPLLHMHQRDTRRQIAIDVDPMPSWMTMPLKIAVQEAQLSSGFEARARVLGGRGEGGVVEHAFHNQLRHTVAFQSQDRAQNMKGQKG